MVDRSLILRKLAELEEYLEQLREFTAVTPEEYSKDWKTQRIVERTLQMMIELCVDICNHIIADKKLRTPTSYADSFRVLREAGLFSESLLEVMENMAKFRNIVVHHYDNVDGAIVVMILSKHLDDFITFRDAILLILKGEMDNE
ncbi:MAG: DUF86 domain-containing protein [Desulfoferrobacter sp.]